MSRVLDLAQKLVKLETETNSVKAELRAALDSVNAKPKTAPKKAATPRKKADKPATDSPTEKAPKRASLKDHILAILDKSPEGMPLQGLVTEIHDMVKRNEYATNAKSLTAVVSQAVNGLKQEEKIKHDRESKKYSRAS